MQLPHESGFSEDHPRERERERVIQNAAHKKEKNSNNTMEN